MDVQKVVGEEKVADILPKNMKQEVLAMHMADMGFTKTTRREMDDEMTCAHEQINSQSSNATKTAGGIVLLQHHFAEVRRIDENPWRPTHNVSSEPEEVHNHQNIQYYGLLYGAHTRERNSCDLRSELNRLDGAQLRLLSTILRTQFLPWKPTKHIHNETQHFQHPARLWSSGGFPHQRL